MLLKMLGIGLLMAVSDTRLHQTRADAHDTYYGYVLIEYERPSLPTVRYVSQVRTYCERIGVGSTNPVNIMKLRAQTEADALERSGRLFRGNTTRRTVSFYGGNTTFEGAEKSRSFYYGRLKAIEYESTFEDGAGCSNDD